MSYLILVRHGESIWNAKGIWTGWTDIGLSKKGIEEAKTAGDLIKDLPINTAFTSDLIRAKQTLDEILKIIPKKNIPVIVSPELKERNYGDLTGKNKWKIKKEYGEEQFLKIRRGWDVPIANGESLKDVYSRVLPYYKEHILPLIQQGKNVLISAHGNSLRALIKYLENIADNEISNLEFGTGTVYVYQLDNQGKIISKEILGAKQAQ
jgi:2,3-bisphosphoglycerate-dependent phosphoglycerate mutase